MKVRTSGEIKDYFLEKSTEYTSQSTKENRTMSISAREAMTGELVTDEPVQFEE